MGGGFNSIVIKDRRSSIPVTHMAQTDEALVKFSALTATAQVIR
jgi:hypothetical protein